MTWQLASFLILALALALGFAWYERSRPPARVLALVAALAALAVVGRLAFAPFPNVKPTTDIVLIAGYALGGAPGFAVGAVTALVSNVFLAHGPWTPWQMAAWGGVGVAGGALGTLVRGRGWRPWRTGRPGGEPRELGRWPLALACGLAGLGFGVVMDLYLWTLAAEQTGASYLAIAARSLPFNVAHIAGNVVFCLLIGPPLVQALRRYRRRFEVRWAPPGAARPHAAGVSAAVAVVAGAMVIAGAPLAQADDATVGAERYLRGAQNGDGGVGRAPGQGSSTYMTSWASLGLAAAGRNPRDVERGRESLMDYLRRNVTNRDDTNDLERAIVVLRAADLSPRRFEGGALYRELVRRRDNYDGPFDDEDKIDLAAFGVIALRAAGDRPSSSRIQETVGWLSKQANADDGGFGFKPGQDSDVDDTGLVLQALAAAGQSRGETAEKAATYVKGKWDPRTGGFRGEGGVNAQSTAYAVQGLIAAGKGRGVEVRRALAYMRSLSADDGGIRSAPGARSSVWVTSQVLAALKRKPYPLKPVALRSRAPKPPPEDPPGKAVSGNSADENDDRPRRRDRSSPRPGSGSGSGNGSGTAGSGPRGVPTGPGPGSGAPAYSIGTTATPFTASPLNLPGLSGSIGAAGALATPAGALPSLPTEKPKTPGQLLSGSPAARPKPSRPVAATKPLAAEKSDPGPRIGAGVLLVVLVGGGLLLATGGGARLSRLWAAARRRTS